MLRVELSTILRLSSKTCWPCVLCPLHDEKGQQEDDIYVYLLVRSDKKKCRDGGKSLNDNDLVISALLDGITNNGFRESETHLRLRDSEVGPAYYFGSLFLNPKG